MTILRRLAEKGPLNKFRICKELSGKRELDCSPNSVLYAMLDLEKNGWIKVDHTEASRGVDKVSNYYDLSPRGLGRLISHLNPAKSSAIFDRLAEKYRNLLPGIFDMWPLLNQIGAGELARIRIVDISPIITLPSSDELADPTKIIESYGTRNPEALTRYFIDEATDTFWDPGGHLFTEAAIRTADAWAATLTKNEALKKKAMGVILRRETARIRSRSQQIKNLGGQGLALSTGEAQDVKTLLDEIEEQGKVIQNLRLAVHMLQDVSGLKKGKYSFEVVIPKKEESGDQKT